MWEANVPADRVGMRIQEGLVGMFPDVLPSRKGCKKALEAGRVTLVRQGTEAVAGTAVILQAGDVVRVAAAEVRAVERRVALTIGFEDGMHAAVWKPAGWVTSGAGRPNLRAALPGVLQPSVAPDRLGQPEPVHRLDRDTAGWILVAKTRRAAGELGRQVATGGGAAKGYCALCRGAVPPALVVAAPLDGRAAMTEVVRRGVGGLGGGEASWVEVKLHTGRTHQIRRHLAGIGHPVVGDERYGGGSGGLMLVAVDLAYNDPESGERRELHAPLPKRFRRIPWLRP